MGTRGRVGIAAVVMAGAALVASCGAGSVVTASGPTGSSITTSATTGSGPLDDTPTGTGGQPTRIVQLGDSVASGEGTLYGYSYDPSSQEWTGGNVDATWPGPYPLCHDSPDAYGHIVADYFGASFLQLACTGASFANGITVPESDGSTAYAPAQFGNWANQTDLDAAYDLAQPDLVLVTLGADDLHFVDIVEDCIENGYEYAFYLADLACIPANPGAAVERDYVDFIPTLRENYATLVDSIEARAAANGVAVPRIVFTSYANPLPPDGAQCPDTNWLYAEQTAYLSSLVDQLNSVITDTITGLGRANVTVADISRAYTPQGVSHIWCSDAPWAYGLSIYKVTHPSSFESQAPFHPTPAGQESLAAHVIPAVRAIFGEASPVAAPPRGAGG
jgi:hypothetical protein